MGTFNETLQRYFDEAIEAAKNGLTLAEVFQIIQNFVTLAVRSAMTLSNPGPEKKALVLEWVMKLVDALLPSAVGFPWSILLSLANSIVRAYVSGSIESAYEWAIKLPPLETN